MAYAWDCWVAMHDALLFLEGRDESSFRSDTQLRYALERAVLIMGEASNRISENCVIGPVRQELLSAFRHQEQFDKLKHRFAAFPDLLLVSEEYELAASAFNRCQSEGIQGSNYSSRRFRRAGQAQGA